jgi:hypothetical protein
MKKWTKDEEDLLKAFIENSWYHIDIANELDRTKLSIEHKTSRLKFVSKLTTAKLKTHKQYIKDLAIKCPTIICLGTYKRNYIPILHKCLLCNTEQLCTPHTKLSFQGCKYCGYSNNGGGIPLDKEGITYLVYIYKYDLYKLGITSKTIKERMRDNKISKYEIILEHKFSNGIDAMKLEKKWKKNLKEYLVNTGKLHSGNTETFRI